MRGGPSRPGPGRWERRLWTGRPRLDVLPVSWNLGDKLNPPKTIASWLFGLEKGRWEEVDLLSDAQRSWKSREVRGRAVILGRACDELQVPSPTSRPNKTETGQNEGPLIPDQTIFPKKAPSSAVDVQFPDV